MGNAESINQMLRNLSADNIIATKEFYKDICSLIDTDVNKFIKEFSKDMKIFNIGAYNRFEELYINTKQKLILQSNKLYRYEYRRSNKNVKCIFVLEREDGRKILLNAFSEDGDKKKGKKVIT